MKTNFLNKNKDTHNTHFTKRILLGIVSSVIFSALLVGCSSEIPVDDIKFDTYSVDDRIEIEVDTENEFTIKKPLNECDIELNSAVEGIDADIDNDVLNVMSNDIGEKEIDATLVAEGYKDTNVKLLFNVVPHELQIEALELSNINDKNSGKEIIDNKVFFTRGNKKAILLSSNTTAEFTAKSDNDKVSATIADGVLTLSSNDVCEANITVKATAENYSEGEYTFSVVVKPTKTNISSSESNISIDIDKKHIITLNYDEKTAIEIGYSKEIINVARLDNKLSVTALNSGKGKITITAQKEGYLPTTKQISVTVNDPAIIPTGNGKEIIEEDEIVQSKSEEKALVGIELQNNSVNLRNGEVSNVLVVTDPINANIEASVISGDATCEVNDKTIVVTGGSNESEIKVIANHSDRASSYVILKVEVNNQPEAKVQEVEDTLQQSPSSRTAAEIIRLTNEYREENGVAPLKYVSAVDEAAQIRADEASERWSHTRPDGSNYNTVFDEVGIGQFGGNGENLFMATYTPSAKEVVDAWISSPGHRANLVRPEFTGLSIGICKTSDGEYYCSQLFIID